MPKVIKKKAAKTLKTEEGVKNVLHDTKEFITERQRIVLPSVIAVVVIALAVAGFLMYRSHARSQAAALEYEGYKIYYGLYEKQPLQKEERYQKALEKFKKAYDANKSPFSLFYIAGCYYDLAKYDDALKTLKDLTERFAGDDRFVPLAYHKMATITLKKGDKEGYLKLLDSLYQYKTGPLKDLALVESARMLEAMGKKEDAAKKYEELTKNFPASPFAEEARTKIGEKKG
jgi:predicted negative regulator of RcsB-dependent stress response